MAGAQRFGGSGGIDAEAAQVVELLKRKFPDGAPTDEIVRTQGFNWSLAQWRKRWPSSLAMPPQLHEDVPPKPYVNRQDVFDRARSVETEADALELFLLMAAWGTGTSAQRIARVAQVLHQGGAPERLLSSSRAVRQGDPVEAYRRMGSWGHDRIKFLGPSFFTKWLYFSAFDSWGNHLCPAPLILDERVAQSLGWRTDDLPATRYGHYLNLATAVRDAWAPSEPTHVVEYALFTLAGS